VRSTVPCCCSLAVLHAGGKLSVSSPAGSAEYELGVAVPAVEVLAITFDGARFRVCINLACPQPTVVSAEVAH
jgi:hypothetical protein